MRVLVEFFDKEPLENVIPTCVYQPEIVVFLCDTKDTVFFKESAVYRLFKRRKIKSNARFYYIDATNINEILRALKAIYMDYPGCVFNFSGGSDLILAVAGAFSQKYSIPAFYIDVKNERFIDIYKCGYLEAKFKMPVFSLEDSLAISGATIHGYGHFTKEEMDDEFEKDVLDVWEIVNYNPKAWGEFVGDLQAICSGSHGNVLKLEGVKNRWHNSPILRRLHSSGIMTNTFTKNSKTGTIVFKSLLHKKSLLNQGIWLELFCYVQAKNTEFFNDVRTSVVLDWDGVEGGSDNTKNEVDVLLLKGVKPIFVSCKMSLPSALALSEIYLLSKKFGGRLSSTVLLTAGKLSADSKAIQTRAQDLGIHIIDREFTGGEELGKELIRIAGY